MPISDTEIAAICDERLGRWKQRLIEQHSTPLVMLAVGHDQKSGQLLVLTLEEVSEHTLVRALRFLHAQVCGPEDQHG
jgi:hypothetical protein